MAGRTTAKGWGYAHQKERRRWAPVVARGDGWCAERVCLMPDRWIPPGSAWDLAHNEDRSGYLGPAHAKCNRTEGAKRAHGEQRPARRWAL